MFFARSQYPIQEDDEHSDRILKLCPNSLYIVTVINPDINAQSILKEQITHYTVIKFKRGLWEVQLKVRRNPT